MNRSSILLLLPLVLLLAACGSSNKTLTPAPSKQTLKHIPKWYLDVPQDPNYLFAPASATSRDMQLAIDQARMSGRGEIAQQLEVKFTGLLKRFQEETGIGEESEFLQMFSQTYKAVISQVLIGSRTSKQEIQPEGTIYRAYVLMEMPIGQANAALMQQLRSNQAMYTRFRATKAFEEPE